MAGDDPSTLVRLTQANRPLTVWLRRLTLLALLVLVVLDLCGLFGLHTSEVSAQGQGYGLTVQYPAVARAGLDINWQVRVHHAGGFGKQLTLRMSSSYGDILEHQGYSPQPSSETQDGRYDYMTFDVPDGDTFVLALDAYIQPSSQQGKSAEVAVLAPDGVPLVAVHYRTRLMP